ncbi:GNAT family N-acetyltransferase [Rathayibacter sp. VKM Ac-2803]|uniref:GNAT family N-acetyltransferase n=1 Tax=unclassified Rathayibacter TaxID=2609250 RepID=UPI00135B29CC|nr:MULTISPECIES: GNAT family N-acetyltransferase [unclassified Rathayibacter]MWV48714.1 GNAT family N-acetyltransferase [Rathayibacter sp. VKM Ac-2803]MWV60321.1 GNAT family N-acetyltransferase [Rathayibacter sp. VKM Ac-2754]
MSDEQHVTVEEDRDRSRFEVLLDGERAGVAAYEQRGRVRTFTHTVVFPEFGGHGLGSALAAAVLADARAQGYEVVPQCPFIAAYIGDHREWLDIVDPASRERLTS